MSSNFAYCGDDFIWNFSDLKLNSCLNVQSVYCAKTSKNESAKLTKIDSTNTHIKLIKIDSPKQSREVESAEPTPKPITAKDKRKSYYLMCKGKPESGSEEKKINIKKGFLNNYKQKQIHDFPHKLHKINSFDWHENILSGIEIVNQNAAKKKISMVESWDKLEFSPLKVLQNEKIPRVMFSQNSQKLNSKWVSCKNLIPINTNFS